MADSVGGGPDAFRSVVPGGDGKEHIAEEAAHYIAKEQNRISCRLTGHSPRDLRASFQAPSPKDSTTSQ